MVWAFISKARFIKNKVMDAARQLVFDLPHRVADGRADFFVADSNAHAVEMIDHWPDWPSRVMILTGPPHCGKTHLAAVWREMSGARLLDDKFFSGEILPVLSQPLVIDDLDKKINTDNEEKVFSLMNQVIHGGGFLLLTATPPSSGGSLWQEVKLADLRSRLSAAPLLALSLPDESLIGAVMIKMFADRQLDVGESVIAWLLARMERSFAQAFELVEELDRQALSRGRPITIALAREVLAQAGS